MAAGKLVDLPDLPNHVSEARFGGVQIDTHC
jgi:hypothetical protein